MDPAQILQSVQQAALAAAQAAQAMREANEKRVTGFGEASKMVQCPKEFGTSSSVEDQAQWSDSAFSFKQWLFLADWAFETDIKYAEDNPNTPVAFQDNAVGQASKERSRKMYSVLAGILKSRPLKVLRQVTDANGFEAYRQLHDLYAPRTKGRAMALLSALMGFPAFQKDKTSLEHPGADKKYGETFWRVSQSKWTGYQQRYLAQYAPSSASKTSATAYPAVYG